MSIKLALDTQCDNVAHEGGWDELYHEPLVCCNVVGCGRMWYSVVECGRMCSSLYISLT